MTRFRRIALVSALGLFASVPVLLTGQAAFAVPATTTTLTSTTPVVTGQSITFTAKVTPKTGTTAPTGSVTFIITGSSSTPYNCDGPNPAGLTTSGSSGLAHCVIAAGLTHADSPYSVTASYAGDDGSSMVGPVSKAVGLGPTTTHVTSSSNPSNTGQPVSFTATVAAAGPATGNPPGSVTFTITPGDGSTPPTCDGGDGPYTLSSEMAMCSLSSGLNASGTPYKVSAKYTDDPSDNNYASSTGSVSQTVGKALATVTVTSMAGNGSGPANTSETGEPVSFTATVTDSGALTGSMVFSLVGEDGSTPMCNGGDTVSISGQTQATCSFPGGLAGKGLNYTVTAKLSDPNYRGSGSLVETVNPAGTSTTVSVPVGKLAFQSFTLVAKVRSLSPGAGDPRGVVTFGYKTAGANCTTNPGLCWGGTVTIPSSTGPTPGTVSVSFPVSSGRAAGYYDVTATYQGSSNYFSSVSSTMVLYIAKESPKIYLQSSHNPSRSLQQVTFKAAVLVPTQDSAEGGPPRGNMTFKITDKNGASSPYQCQGGSNTIPLDKSVTNEGIAACSIPSGMLTAADSPFVVKAVYSGDANNHGGGKTLTQNVVG